MHVGGGIFNLCCELLKNSSAPDWIQGSLRFCFIFSNPITRTVIFTFFCHVPFCFAVHDAKSPDGMSGVQMRLKVCCVFPHRVLQFPRICPWRRGMSCQTSDAGRGSCSMILRCVDIWAFSLYPGNIRSHITESFRSLAVHCTSFIDQFHVKTFIIYLFLLI